jgi:ATP-dependent HslUV protease subunit HslV
MHKNENTIYGTTILAVKKEGQVVIGGDGQVSIGHSVMKSTATKVRKIYGEKIIAGFAGATADAFTLFERLEKKLEQFQGQLLRASVELAKDWRTDKYLRHLEALMIVSDGETILILTGNGDVIEPENGVAAIGSGGNYALSAARALIDINSLSAEEVVRRAMKIASEICVYTNNNLTIEKI